MADTRGLTSLNPYDLQDRECDRLARHMGSLSDKEWAMPSACEGWTRRDLLGHLVAVEDYFAACLDGSVAALMRKYMDAGATSLDDFNAVGVSAGSSRPADDLLEEWIDRNGSNRAGFRAADGSEIDSSIGAYPCRLQAFHVAFEYGIHGDDMGSPVDESEVEERQAWLAEVARFALTEIKDDLSVEPGENGYVVTQAGESIPYDRDTFVAGVSGRAAHHGIEVSRPELLDLGY